MSRLPRHLVIMAKEPRAGAVKTRLAQGIGVSAATGFYRNTLARQLLSSGHDPRWQSWLAIAPDTALEARCWPMSITPIAQGRGDLGARMQRVFDRLPPGPAVIIGSDIPAIRPRHIAAAFRLLGSADAVFGPAEDGGYWLVGLRRCPRILKIFRDVRWSGPQALADTCSNLENQKTRFLETLYDIDTAEDYRRWKRRSAP